MGDSIVCELAYCQLCNSYAILDLATKLLAKRQTYLISCLAPIEQVIFNTADSRLVTNESITELVNAWDRYKEAADRIPIDEGYQNDVDGLAPTIHAFEECLLLYMAANQTEQ